MMLFSSKIIRILYVTNLIISHLSVKPILTLEPRFDQPVQTKVGASLTVPARVEAHPNCDFEWGLNDKALAPDRAEVTSSGDSSTLVIKGLKTTDSGKLYVRAKNDYGQDMKAINLHVRDRPQPPEKVTVEKVGEERVTIGWRQPASDGGARLKGYRVEKRKLPSGNWTKAAETGPLDERAVVKSLMEDQTYSFRVSAFNEIGESEAVEVENPVEIKSCRGEAGDSFY